MIQSMIKKVAGIIICLIGIGVWYADYLVFRAIGAICGYLASLVGITGTSSVGVMIIGWFIGLGVMVGIFAIGAMICILGAKVFAEEL